MGNPPFDDVSPIQNGGFPIAYGSLPEGISKISFLSIRQDDFSLP